MTKYKLTSYQIFLGAEINIEPEVLPLGIFQHSPTEFYVMCLEPVPEEKPEVKEEKVEKEEAASGEDEEGKEKDESEDKK